MRDITYESIEKLIEKAEQTGSTMQCVFVCPVSGTQITSSAGIRQSQELVQKAKDRVKRGLWWRIRSEVSRTLRRVLGHNIVGRLASDVAGSVVSDVANKSNQSFSEEEKRTAVVEAFRTSGQFVFDPKQGWLAVQAAQDVLSDFAKQLLKAPVEQNYDRGVLARMLVEVAQADGRMAAEEVEFLNEFMSPDLGTVDELRKRNPLSQVELSETTNSEIRATMLMAAWALACSDRDLDQAEIDRLQELANGLGISEDRAQTLKQYAQSHIIDQTMDAVYPDGKVDEAARQEVLQLSQKLGVPQEDIERIEIRYRKRNGIF